jgi:hypothetical protein
MPIHPAMTGKFHCSKAFQPALVLAPLLPPSAGAHEHTVGTR